MLLEVASIVSSYIAKVKVKIKKTNSRINTRIMIAH